MQDVFRLDGSVLGSLFGSVFSSVRSGSVKKLPDAIGEKPLQLCSGHNRRKCRETRERWLYPNVHSCCHRLSLLDFNRVEFSIEIGIEEEWK